MSGELTAWLNARDNAANQLVQVVVDGDSTFAGQVRDGAAPNYSPVTRLRALLGAAGLPDGGHGVMNGSLDTPSVSGESSDANATDPAYNFNNGQNLQANYAGSTNIPGMVYAANVYGTRVVVRWALYNTPTVLDVTIDGQTTRVTTATKTNNVGSGADYNWQAGGHRLFGGLSNGRHVVTITLVSGRMSVLVEATRETGIVLHNFAGRGQRAVDVPWHQMQAWAGRTATSSPPVAPAAANMIPGALNAVLGIYAKGINDQQGNGSTDASAAYQAKAFDFARSFTANGKSAVICSPWWESAGHPEFADNFRAASQQAAEDAGAAWLDLGPDGALAGHMAEDLGGSNANPHLTALAYQYQGDYLAETLLAGAGEPVGPGQPGLVNGRPVIGYRLRGQPVVVLGTRKPA